MARIIFFVSSMQGGGAERVAALLCNEWVARGHNVMLIPTYSARGECAYPLAPEVKLEFLADEVSRSDRCIDMQLKRLVAMRRQILKFKPDVIVSFLTRVNVGILLAAWDVNVPVVVCERTYPPLARNDMVTRCLRKLLYPRADAVVMQTDKGVRWVKDHCRGAEGVKFPNPVVYPIPQRPDALPIEGVVYEKEKLMLAVGRLHRLKGFDLLVSAFARLAEEFPDWRLVVLGEGQERERLESQCSKMGVAERVSFPGVAGNMSEWYERADLFVLSSRYEGFPNVLLEAMAHGIAVISHDCDTGPGEMIRHNVNGLLLPLSQDPGDLAGVIRSLMNNEDERARLGKNAIAVRNTHNLEVIADRWIELFERLRGLAQ